MGARKSQAMFEQIRVLHEAGHGIRKIAEVLKISRNTVRSHLRSKPAENPDNPLSIQPSWGQDLDWEQIKRARNSGVTAKQLYQENSVSVSYSQFSKYLQKLEGKKSVSLAPALKHTPGERTQIDYADGLLLTEPKTGKKAKTQLFCGVLPFSSLTFAEFSQDQKLANFIRSQERMWHYFGGVTPYVVIDNLKSGVTRSHRYDPDINPTYCDYGNHTGFAVLAARPRTPRDKAAVEAAIGVIQRSFYQRHRETKFYSLEKLNHALRQYLDELNSHTMKEFGVSRRDRFANESKHLLPLPDRPYEIFEIKTAKVHPDCCIQVAKALYSLPFRYVGQEVRVKISDKTVEITDKTNYRIAFHLRQPPYGRSIEDSHMPPVSLQVRSFDVVKAKAKASSIGEKTKDYIDWQFEDERPLRVLRRVQGVIRLYERGFKCEAMEYAATQALQFRRRDLRYFTNCANYFSKTGGMPPTEQLTQKRSINPTFKRRRLNVRKH